MNINMTPFRPRSTPFRTGSHRPRSAVPPPEGGTARDGDGVKAIKTPHPVPIIRTPTGSFSDPA